MAQDNTYPLPEFKTLIPKLKEEYKEIFKKEADQNTSEFLTFCQARYAYTTSVRTAQILSAIHNEFNKPQA